MSTTAATASSHYDERALAALLALLWNPPDGAEQPDANAAHARGQELVKTLLTKVGYSTSAAAQMVAAAKAVVEDAARVAMAADYLPGARPDDYWTGAPETIAHPLAAGSGTPRPTRTTVTAQDVNNAITGIAKTVTAGPDAVRQLALAVWRQLPEQPQFVYGTPPLAHPAYPDSAWAVGALRAAVAGARKTTGERPALLIVTIASVQEYIGAARRTQDLWMGSLLYAYFIWHAMKPIVEELDPWAILTPDLRGQPFVDQWLQQRFKFPRAAQFKERLGIASLPNIFTALVPYEEGERLAHAAAAAIRAARDRVATSVHDYVAAAAQSVGIGLDESVWQAQVEDFVKHDVFWSLVPWDSPDDCRNQLQVLTEPRSEWQKWYGASGAANAPGAGFPLAGHLAAQLLTMRKNRRDFGQVTTMAAGHLCTLCATHVALPLTMTITGSKSEKPWAALAGVLLPDGAPQFPGRVKMQGRIRDNEQLCAVCLVKRLALDAYFDDDHQQAHARRKQVDEAELQLDRHRFPSTATVATLPFRKQLYEGLAKDRRTRERVQHWLDSLNQAVSEQERIPVSLDLQLCSEVKKELEDLKRADRNTADTLAVLRQLDGAWLYTSTYTKEAVKRELGIELDDKEQGALEEAARRYRDVLNQLREWSRAQNREYAPPARYFAVLALDGDKIGDWLSGRHNPTFEHLLAPTVAQNINCPDLKRPPGPLSQAALAGAGRAFGLEVASAIVREHDGTLIYAGGDDTLALVPRERALALAIALEQRFRSLDPVKGDWLMGDKATISAVIVVAHQNQRLSEVIRQAQDILKRVAKKNYGRNAFAVHLLKRSGPAATGGAHWRSQTLDPNAPPGAMVECAALVDQLRATFADGTLSRGLLSDVRHALPALGAPSGEQRVTTQPTSTEHQLLDAELRRLTKRHTQPQAVQRMQKILDDLYQMARWMLDEQKDEHFVYCPVEPRPRPWDVIYNLLRVAEFLAREDEE